MAQLVSNTPVPAAPDEANMFLASISSLPSMPQAFWRGISSTVSN
jgi:hypothetical protein